MQVLTKFTSSGSSSSHAPQFNDVQMLLEIVDERIEGETHLISHSFVLSTLWDMSIH